MVQILTCCEHWTIGFAGAAAFKGHAIIPMIAIRVWLPSGEAIETHTLRGKTNACQQTTVITACNSDPYISCRKEAEYAAAMCTPCAAFMADTGTAGFGAFMSCTQLLCLKNLRRCLKLLEQVFCTYKAVPALVDHLHLIVIQADIKWNWVISTHTCSIFVFVSWTCHDGRTNAVQE